MNRPHPRTLTLGAGLLALGALAGAIVAPLGEPGRHTPCPQEDEALYAIDYPAEYACIALDDVPAMLWYERWIRQEGGPRWEALSRADRLHWQSLYDAQLERGAEEGRVNWHYDDPDAGDTEVAGRVTR